MHTDKPVSLLWMLILIVLTTLAPPASSLAKAVSIDDVIQRTTKRRFLEVDQRTTAPEVERSKATGIRLNLAGNQEGGQSLFSTMPVSTTTIRLPLIMRNYPPFCNGGFETPDLQCWSFGGSPLPTQKCSEETNGSCVVLLGDPTLGDGAAGGIPIGSSWIEQIAYVPDTDAPKLSIQYQIITYDSNAHALFDTFDITINGELAYRDGNDTEQFGRRLEIGWKAAEIPLEQYKGRLVRLRFANWNRGNDQYNTWTYVDDITIVP